MITKSVLLQHYVSLIFFLNKTRHSVLFHSILYQYILFSSVMQAMKSCEVDLSDADVARIGLRFDEEQGRRVDINQFMRFVRGERSACGCRTSDNTQYIHTARHRSVLQWVLRAFVESVVLSACIHPQYPPRSRCDFSQLTTITVYRVVAVTATMTLLLVVPSKH